MANITEWSAAVTTTALADNTALASRSAGYYNICQVSAADVVIDNATNKDLYLGVWVQLGSWTPAVTDYLELYTCYSGDGTNYESGSSTFLPPPDRIWRTAQLSTDTSAAAKKVLLFGRIMPFKTKILWRWKGTNATAASGNTFDYFTYNFNLNA